MLRPRYWQGGHHKGLFPWFVGSCEHTLPYLRACEQGREQADALEASSSKGTLIPPREDPILMNLLNPNHLPNTPSTNTITLGVGRLTY